MKSIFEYCELHVYLNDFLSIFVYLYLSQCYKSQFRFSMVKFTLLYFEYNLNLRVWWYLINFGITHVLYLYFLAMLSSVSKWLFDL